MYVKDFFSTMRLYYMSNKKKKIKIEKQKDWKRSQKKKKKKKKRLNPKKHRSF